MISEDATKNMVNANTGIQPEGQASDIFMQRKTDYLEQMQQSIQKIGH